MVRTFAARPFVTSGFTNAVLDAERRAMRAATVASVNRTLTAPTYDEADAAALAARDTYAIVVRYLVAIAAPLTNRIDSGLVAFLWVSPPSCVIAHRAAIAFGIASVASTKRDEIVSYEQLKNLADGGDNDARCALAAIGHGRTWLDSSRRERATLLLREVIRARREAAS